MVLYLLKPMLHFSPLSRGPGHPEGYPGPYRARLHRLQRGLSPLTDAPRGLCIRRAWLHSEAPAEIAWHDIRAMPQLARYPPQALGHAPAIPCPLHGFVIPEAT